MTVAECSFFWKPHGDESVDVTIKVLSGYVDTHWYGIGFAKVCSSSTFLTILGVEELNTQAPLSRPCNARRLGNQRRHLLERRQRRKWHLLKRRRQRRKWPLLKRRRQLRRIHLLKRRRKLQRQQPSNRLGVHFSTNFILMPMNLPSNYYIQCLQTSENPLICR